MQQVNNRKENNWFLLKL